MAEIQGSINVNVNAREDLNIEFGIVLALVSGGSSRRSQQDIELMILLSKKPGWNKQMVSAFVDSAVNLASATSSRNAEDPGSIKFSSVTADQLNRLKLSLQQELVK